MEENTQKKGVFIMIKKFSVVLVSLSVIFSTQVSVQASILKTNVFQNTIFLNSDFFNPFDDVASDSSAESSAADTGNPPPSETIPADTTQTDTFDPFAGTNTDVDSPSDESSRFSIVIDGVERFAEYDTAAEYYVIYDSDNNKLGYSKSLTPPVSITSFDVSNESAGGGNADPFSAEENTVESDSDQDAKGNPTTADSGYILPAFITLGVVVFFAINSKSLKRRQY